MTASIVTQPITPLPRDIDVSISINRPQTEIATDLSLLVFCTPNIKRLPPNNGRVALASSSKGLLEAAGWGQRDTGTNAVLAWSSQEPKAQRMAVGRVFTERVQPQVMAAAITDYVALKSVTDGALVFDVTDSSGTPATVNITSISFASVSTLPAVVTALNTAIAAASANTILQASVDYDNRLVITALGAHDAISYPIEPGAGTDIAGLLKLNYDDGGQKWDAYEPEGLVGEVRLILRAMEALGSPAFVVALDKMYRDTPEQKAVTDYVEGSAFKLASTMCTNSPTAYDPADTTNICFHLKNLGYRASSAIYSSATQQYPEISLVQDTLSTNYSLSQSTGTAKFKNGVGISPENINETQLQALNDRNCNVFVRVGNTARTFREGTMGADTWWMDSYYGVSNLREELQTAVFNLLLKRRKVPFDHIGQAMVKSVMEVIFARYVFNGFLSNRQELDESLDSPYVTRKAYDIVPTPIYLATESERATRTLPPFNSTAYEAGAAHKINIGLNLVN